MTTAPTHAERYDEIRKRINSLYAELPLSYPSSPDWIRITEEIDEATVELVKVRHEWEAAIRGEQP